MDFGEGTLDWNEVYERLARRPGQPDLLAWAEMERRVRAWAGVRATGLGREAADEVAAAVCADVWQHLRLARGGSTFEGFVQGRFVAALRVLQERLTPWARLSQEPLTPRPPLPHAGEGGTAGEQPGSGLPRLELVIEDVDDGRAREAARVEGLRAALAELRGRNPRHHRAVELMYVDEATVREAADALAVDTWTLRALVTRAQAALAQGLVRVERKLAPAGDRRPRPSSRAKPGRGGGKRRRQGKGRPPAGGRPR